jgi:hypothetical protein
VQFAGTRSERKGIILRMPEPDLELQRALASILEEARAQVAAGRAPNVGGLEERVRRVARAARVDAAVASREEQAALRRLGQVAAVHRSRALVAREPGPPPARRAPAAFRTKPTISGTLGVRRADGEGFRLAWDRVPTVTEWEVRFSERADARSDYVDGETLVLAGGETGVEVPLGDALLRVNIIGRDRGGRLQRRALISGLTRENWRERWQRRASA